MKLIATLLATTSLTIMSQSPDIPITDFKTSQFSGWTSTGTAFSPGLASRSHFKRLEVGNAVSDIIICSELEGDQPRGTLTSPKFTISRKYISYLIGGGDYEIHTCLNLVVDGKVVKSATGRRSDQMYAASWDVSAFQGKHAHIEVVDEASGDWGHINVDQILQTDRPSQLPVSTEPLYKESLRPLFHFTARQWTMDRLNPVERQEGWINDLNGLIYHEGEYHLFAQRWNKCWIHAVSKDLVHWTELEPAFWEDELDSGVQSGTCVIDYENTSGLAKDKSKPAMIAFWSRNDNRSQGMHYSLDKGRTWQPYVKNPFLVYPERDPKVFWYGPGKHWVMMLYGDGKYHIFTSSNLLEWKDENNPLPDSFECPDIFELPVDGNKNRRKWVLIQGNGNYSIGSFDGKKFTEETGRRPCDVGPNFYATQTWENTQTGDGRRIQTAWMRGSKFPDMPFSQQISFPCELTLRNTPDGLRIFREPVKEIAKLHGEPTRWTSESVQTGSALTLAKSGDAYRLVAKVKIPTGAKLVFNLRGTEVTLGSNSVESGHDPVKTQGDVKSVEILLDKGSVETFVNGGEVSSTRYALASHEGISVRAVGGAVEIESLTLYPLKSSWK